MMKKASIFILILMLFNSPASAQDLKYSCPYINNKAKQTIGQIYQGYDGWFFKDIDFKQNYLLSPKTLSFMARFNRALSKKNIELIFLPLVSKALIGYSKITESDRQKLDYNYDEIATSYIQFVNQLKESDIAVPDLLKSFQDYDQNRLHDLIFKIDHHWTPEGAKKTAELIADLIKNNKNYDDYSKIKTTYKKLDKPLTVPSSMHVETQNLCSDKIPSEQLNIYDFDIVTEKNEDALFGDDDGPAPIALIGTSFSSVNNFKFRDFLENETGLEVVNYSIPGGGLYTSMISYLSSPFFAESKPQYLIWETPSKYNYNDAPASYFRQIIPSVYGECPKDKIIAETTTSLEKSSKEGLLFSNLSKHQLTGSDYYLQIKTTNPVFNAFTLNMEYDDGDGEWFNMDHSGRYKNSGIFYIELSDDIESHLSDIMIENIDDISTQLNVKICVK